MRVGFVGLGDMGAPMCKHIIAGGFELAVFDLRDEAVQSLVERGARRAADLPALAAVCDVVFICVVNDEQVLAVVDEISAGLRRGSVVVVVSSVLPETMEHVNAQLEPHGVAVLDGPVTGSRPAAAAGTLTVIVGGAAEILDSVRPVLDTFAKEVIRVGTVGAGQAVKIANNVMLHMNHLIAIEAVEFAKAHGLDEQTVLKVANVGTGRSWVTETWDVLDEMFSDHPQADTIGIYDMMTKEMWNAVLMSKAAHVDLPLTGLGVQLSRRMLERRVAEQLASGQGRK
jgi:3-hydroxyisobutyrate dehydrogenase